MKSLNKKLTFQEIQKKIKPFFREKGLKLLLLFGSSASQKTHTYSDIDLGCLFDREVNLLNIINHLTKLLHTDNIDVVDLRHASPLMKISAAKNGLVLYEQYPGSYCEFFSLAARMFIDSKKMYDKQALTVQRFIESRNI